MIMLSIMEDNVSLKAARQMYGSGLLMYHKSCKIYHKLL